MSAARAREPVGFAEVADFHVEVARQADPTLRDRSVLVGGDPSKRGKVVAVSEDLRAAGIIEGMDMADALDRVGGVTWVRTDMVRAREISGGLRAAVRAEVGAVEVDGLGGFYLVAPRVEAEALDLAQRLEACVAERTGMPLRMGVAPVRFAARLAAREAGPRGARVISSAGFDDWLRAQPLDRLPGVGPKTLARLAELGAVDVPGLRALGRERLDVLLGSHGRSLWQLACGEDPKPLRMRRHPASLSREETLDDPARDRGVLENAIARLAESLEQALRRDGLSAGRLALRLTALGERTLTRSCPLSPPVSAAGPIASAARGLLDRVELADSAFRRAALVVRGLETAGAEDRQLDLF